MVTEIWVNIGSGNDLLPGSTEPLPGPMFDFPQNLCEDTTTH